MFRAIFQGGKIEFPVRNAEGLKKTYSKSSSLVQIQIEQVGTFSEKKVFPILKRGKSVLLFL